MKTGDLIECVTVDPMGLLEVGKQYEAKNVVDFYGTVGVDIKWAPQSPIQVGLGYFKQELFKIVGEA